MARAAKKTNRRKKIVFWLITLAGLFSALAWHLSRHTVAVLEPVGPVAAGERRLLIIAFLLMMIVVIPVIVLTFAFAWRYRESNKATYRPNWDHSRLFETIWWLVPGALITVLAVITWYSTYEFDPYKPLVSKEKALTVQVVALDWRWLFIYPEQKVASINHVQIPQGVPVRFEITADAPMNSFWLPQLGGQIYAMPGMKTTLYLQADKAGRYNGAAANISGKGFSKMRFVAEAASKTDFNQWVQARQQDQPLTKAEYAKISKASTDTAVYTYSAPAAGLYNSVVNKYMTGHGHAKPIPKTTNTEPTADHDHHDHMDMEDM